MKKFLIAIGILLAVVIVALVITTSKVVREKQVENTQSGALSRDAWRLSIVKQIRTALELYYADHSATYPSGTNIILGKDAKVLTVSGFKQEASGETVYMDAIPANPTPGGTDYKYNCVGQPCTNYSIEFGIEVSARDLGPGLHYATSEGIK